MGGRRRGAGGRRYVGCTPVIMDVVSVVVRRPGHPERRVAIGEGVSHLGRAEDNDIVLTDIGVSRRHARLIVRAGTVFIEDLGSGNGTYFDGSRVNRQSVKDGDEFLIDPFRLQVEIEPLSDSRDGLTGDLEEVDDDDTAEIPIGPSGLPEPNVSGDPQVRLITLQGQRLAPSYPIRSGGLTIGRSEARDIILFDPAASRNHAAIEIFGGDIWFRDQGSGNGSFVNGHRVREQCLRHGDRVRVGSTEFRVEVTEASRQEIPTLPPSPALGRRLEERGPVAVPAVPTQVRVHPSTLQGPKLVALAAAGGFAIVLMMILGGLLAMYVLDRSDTQTRSSAAVAATDIPPERMAEFNEQMTKGNELFSDGEFLKSASKFYSAQMVAPGHPVAERMGAVACEYVVLDALNRGIRLRGMSEEEQRKDRNEAFKQARNALRGRGAVSDALRAVMDVQIVDPDNERARLLIEQLKAK